jgi:hypothetical protein
MREEIRFRKTIYQPGDKVRSVWFSGGAINDNETVPPGTLGVINSVDDMGTVHVSWENGARLGALIEDSIELIN